MFKGVITYLIEAVTAGAMIMMFAAVQCSIWYGFAGLLILFMLCMEVNAWEGGV